MLKKYGVDAHEDYNYWRIGKRIAEKSWMRIRLAEAQNWKCCWCGKDTVPKTKQKNTATIEHITPQSEGGTDDWENLASACSKCNNDRGSQSYETFVAKSLRNDDKSPNNS